MKSLKLRHLKAAVILAGLTAAISAEAAGSDLVRCLTEPVGDVEMTSTVPGTVAHLFFQEGSFVEEGAVVVQLESRSEELDVERRSVLVDRLKATLERSEKLLNNTSSISMEEVDEARSEYRISVLELELAKDSLEKKRVKAPFSGIVTNLPIKEGEFCEPPKILLRMVDPRQFYCIANIDPILAANLSVGDAVTYVSESEFGTGQTRQGKIVFISPVVDPASGLLRVKALFTNPDSSVRPGEGGFLGLVPNS